MTSREEYVRRMHSRLDKLNNEIDALAARKDEITESARAEFGLAAEDLRRRREDAKRQLEQIEKAGEGAWQDMKAGIELAWEAFSQAVESARTRFK